MKKVVIIIILYIVVSISVYLNEKFNANDDYAD